MLTRKAAVEATRKAKKGEGKHDKASMEKLARYIARSEYKKAYTHFRRMDTFVREGIPEDVVYFLNAKKDGGERLITAHVKVKGGGAKKVFKEGFPPGVIMMMDIAFPKKSTDEQISTGLMSKHGEILDAIVETYFTDTATGENIGTLKFVPDL